MDVVVTGATSFLGAPVVRRLVGHGHQVTAVVRPGSGNLGRLTGLVAGLSDDTRAKASPGGCRILALDLKHIGKIRDIPEPVQAADAWIHIGWDGAGSDNRARRDVQQANVGDSLDAVRAAASLGCRRFIFTGSQAEYGSCRGETAEDHVCRPVSEYGKAKAEFGRLAAPLCKSLGMEYIHTRIFSVYGPGDHPWSLVQSCLRTWLQDGTVNLGECTQQWNFLYVEDAVAALCCLLTEGREGVYNIAGNDTRPLRSYIREMYGLCGCHGGYCYGRREQNAEGPADLMPDIGKICRETGWRPTTTFAEGIYETLHSLREGADR